MTAGLVVAVLIGLAIAVAAVWLMRHGKAEPAARGNGQAPDAGEEHEARESDSAPRAGVLVDRAAD